MTVAELLERLPHQGVAGPLDTAIGTVLPLDEHTIRPDVLSWCSTKNIQVLERLPCGVIIVPASAKELRVPFSCTFIYCPDPRAAFRDAFNLLYPAPAPSAYRAASAIVEENVRVGESVHIGHNVVIEADCVLGDGCRIGHNTVLLRGTVLGRRVVIGSNCTIGGTGFGYQPNVDGDQERMPHVGNVVLGDDVEVGNNTCIDRAGMGSTRIGRNVKIDNLVHIAHNAQIGDNTLIIAHAMVAGSCTIGSNAWIAPNAAIRNKCSVGDNAVVGLGAVVVKDVEAGSTVAGNPARPLARK